jgi:hypothetical protein
VKDSRFLLEVGVGVGVGVGLGIGVGVGLHDIAFWETIVCCTTLFSIPYTV